MDITEIATLLKVSKRTIEIRMKALTDTERNAIRSEEKIGSVRRYIYNKKALEVLAGGKQVKTINVSKEVKKEEFTELQHYKVLYENSLKRIEELKQEIKELKADSKETNNRYTEAIKYFESLVTQTQSLMNQQQQLHAKEMTKQLEAPKRFSFFRRK